LILESGVHYRVELAVVSSIYTLLKEFRSLPVPVFLLSWRCRNVGNWRWNLQPIKSSRL